MPSMYVLYEEHRLSFDIYHNSNKVKHNATSDTADWNMQSLIERQPGAICCLEHVGDLRSSDIAINNLSMLAVLQGEDGIEVVRDC